MRKLIPVFLLAILLGMPLLVGAQGEEPPYTVTPPVTTGTELYNLIRTIANWVLVFAILIGVIMLIVGGIMYITAAGSTARAGTASKLIAFAAVGVAVIVLAWGLVQVIATLLGAAVQP